jgi:hypothetical protein
VVILPSRVARDELRKGRVCRLGRWITLVASREANDAPRALEDFLCVEPSPNLSMVGKVPHRTVHLGLEKRAVTAHLLVERHVGACERDDIESERGRFRPDSRRKLPFGKRGQSGDVFD